MPLKNVDIFPHSPSIRVQKLSDYPDFKSLANYDAVRAFCLYMDDKFKIHFVKTSIGRKVSNSLATSFGSEAKTCDRFDPHSIKWEKIAHKFRRPINEKSRVNADTRSGFKINNCYLVRAFFTFGQRTVEAGKAHVIQTLNVPLLYFQKPEFLSKVEKRFFPGNLMHKYERRVLEPHSAYLIPAGVTYLIFTTQKNYFRLDIILETQKLTFNTKFPEKRTFKEDPIYSAPVETPYIEENVEDDDLDSFLMPPPPPVVMNPQFKDVPQVSKSVHPEVSKSVHPEVSQDPFKEVFQSVHPEVSQSVHPEVSQDPFKEVFQSVHPDPFKEVSHPEVSQSVHPEVSQSVHPEVSQSVHPEVSQSVHPEVSQEDPFKEVSQTQTLSLDMEIDDFFNFLQTDQQQSKIQDAIYYILQPPILEKNLTNSDFAKKYQLLTRKVFEAPPKIGLYNNQPTEEPMDLTLKMMDLPNIDELSSYLDGDFNLFSPCNL